MFFLIIALSAMEMVVAAKLSRSFPSHKGLMIFNSKCIFLIKKTPGAVQTANQVKSRSTSFKGKR